MHILLLIIYLSFISLGLPDALLGSAWPVMFPQLGVPVSYAGIISMIISGGTILSSLQSDRLSRRFGTGKVTAFSVALTALALIGFGTSRSFAMLCLWAIPYGLGAGSVDASLNNFIALHFEARHMNWLHSMWGIGASAGPVIMGLILTRGMSWNTGYLAIAVIQILLTLVLFRSLPLWKRVTPDAKFARGSARSKALSLTEIGGIRGVKEVLIMLFCYSSVEGTAGLWASSYLHLYLGIAEDRAAALAALFYVGITAGRMLSGFLSFRYNEKQLIRAGQLVLCLGALVYMLPFGEFTAVLGLGLLGLGCAPIYPSVLHSTPRFFGAENSQAVIGVLMAGAYVGGTLMPPLFGWVAARTTLALLPVYLLLLLALMAAMHEVLLKKVNARLSG